MTKWQDKARGGRPVRVYAEDGAEPWTIHGAVWYGKDGGWSAEHWTAAGRAMNGKETTADLIPAPREAWVWFDASGSPRSASSVGKPKYVPGKWVKMVEAKG